MDQHVASYFSQYSDESPSGHFHRVIDLNDNSEMEWGDVLKVVPEFPRGWFELTRINTRDRIDFTQQYWLSQLPYKEGLAQFFEAFFSQLDDIGIYMTQQKWDDPYVASLVYSLKNNRGFYRGMVPADEEKVSELQRNFPEYILPADYLAFLKVHNGFCKTTDCTGILPSKKVPEGYLELQSILESKEPLVSSRGEAVNPKSLIPFYKSFGMPFFQCFWGQWYPEGEMGNVFYTVFSHEIASTDISKSSPENIAFPSFLDWLVFYLERVE